MKINYIPNRVIDMDGIADGAEIHVYQTGTTTPLNLYIDSNYDTPVSNPYVVAAGAAVPPLYANASSVRVVIVTDNGTEDYDPYDPLSTPNAFGYIPTTLVSDDNGTTGTDNYAALQAAIDYLTATAPDTDGYVKGGGKLLIPRGRYYCSQTLEIKAGITIEGEGTPGHAPATELRFPDGVSGLIAEYYITSGEPSTIVAAHSYGQCVTFRNFGIFGPLRNTESGITGGEAEHHGIVARTTVVVEDMYINGFRGDGLYAETTSGGGAGFEGNSNVSYVNRLRVTNVRNGVFINGADSNAWTIIGVNGTYCRQHTVWDSSFLGNTQMGHHSSGAGMVPGVTPNLVTQGGNRYTVVQGQAVGASTNAPTGTTADNAYWLYLNAGGVDTTANIAAWVSGTTYREGGCYRTDGAGATNTLVGLYAESGQGPLQAVSPTTIVGGLWGTRDPVTTGNYFAGDRVVAPSQTNGNVFGLTKVAYTSLSRMLAIHNTNTLSGGVTVSVNFEQGKEADGITPAGIARIQAYGSTASPATTEGTMIFQTRTFGGTGAYSDRVVIDGPNISLKWAADNTGFLGLSGNRWKTGFFYTVDASSALTIGSGTPLTKIVVYTPTLTPASVAAATVAEQTFTVTGVTTADTVSINPPAIGNATGIAGVRVSAADTVAIRFVNPTAGALTPTSGVYRIIAHRS